MVVEKLLIDNIKVFLETLGDDLLTQIHVSREPLSFGYRKERQRLLLLTRVASKSEDRQATIEIYKVHPLFFGRPKFIKRCEVRLQDISLQQSGLEKRVKNALSRMDSNVVMDMAKSKEPITFTLKNDAEKQVEINLDVVGGGIKPVIFID